MGPWPRTPASHRNFNGNSITNPYKALHFGAFRIFCTPSYRSLKSAFIESRALHKNPCTLELSSQPHLKTHQHFVSQGITLYIEATSEPLSGELPLHWNWVPAFVTNRCPTTYVANADFPLAMQKKHVSGCPHFCGGPLKVPPFHLQEFQKKHYCRDLLPRFGRLCRELRVVLVTLPRYVARPPQIMNQLRRAQFFRDCPGMTWKKIRGIINQSCRTQFRWLSENNLLESSLI